jgi:murein DD-endopeptidase MepM/ murein hydrolase activator NlpD
MTENTKKTKKKAEILRLVLMNDATFKEKFSFRVSTSKVYIWGGAALFMLFVLFFLFISFTPVKRLVPGYASIENNVYVIKMKQYVDELERHIEMQERYNSTLRKLLVGQNDSLILEGSSELVPEQDTEENQINFDEIYAQDQTISRRVNSNRTMSNYYFIPPLTGKVNNKVDFKKGHYGVDIAGSKNAPIKAIMEGIVVFADYTTETGYTIAIQHPNDMLSIYKHNKKLLKDTGNFVANGEAIAIIGNTGTLTDGPHLHFELWYKSTPLNPEDYILFE